MPMGWDRSPARGTGDDGTLKDRPRSSRFGFPGGLEGTSKNNTSDCDARSGLHPTSLEIVARRTATLGGEDVGETLDDEIGTKTVQ
jgi:hypothetical protein